MLQNKLWQKLLIFLLGILITSTGCEQVIPCQEKPLVTYNNFGEGFVRQHCQGCHASTASNRHNAPVTITFDTVIEVWDHADLILNVAVGKNPIMPPQGGVFPEDRELLETWLRCTKEGN